VATDEATQEYTMRTLLQERSAPSIWEAMKNASHKFVKVAHTKDFDKYLVVANPKNGNDFLKEV